LSSIVRGLVLAHVSATALLLLVFLAVVLWQRLAGALERDGAAAVAYPTDAERSATPARPVAPTESGPLAQTAPGFATPGGAEARSDRELQPS
jgi:hypothetical protein